MIAILILLIILLVLACVKCKKENFQDKTTDNKDGKFLSKYVSTGLMLVIVFFILCVNFF